VYDHEVPRLIDHDERDREIGEAAWRVLVRDGLAAFSVRNVADEAGIATASLRRAYPTQDALRVACLRRVFEHVQRRLAALGTARSPDDDPATFATRCLQELLPLDRERRTEAEVWLTLGSLALTDTRVRLVHDEAHGLLRAACQQVVEVLHGSDSDSHSDSVAAVDADAARLHALVDGLALHLVHQPAGDPSDWAVEALAAEVRRLATGRSA